MKWEKLMRGNRKRVSAHTWPAFDVGPTGTLVSTMPLVLGLVVVLPLAADCPAEIAGTATCKIAINAISSINNEK